MARLGATIKVKMDTSAVRRGIMAIRGMFSKLGSIIGRVFTLPRVLAGTAIGAAIMQGTKAATGFAVSLKNMSDQTGVSMRDVLALKQAFKTAGVEIGDDADLISDFQEKLEDALRGGGTAAEGLAMLGLHARNLISMKPLDQFNFLMGRVSASFLTVQEKAFALDKIFGGQGFKLVPLADDFAEKMAEARQDTAGLAESLEGGLTDELVKAHRSVMVLQNSLIAMGLRLVAILPIEKISRALAFIASEIEKLFRDPKTAFDRYLAALKKIAVQFGEWVGEGIKNAIFSFKKNAAGIQKGAEAVNPFLFMLEKTGAKDLIQKALRGPEPMRIAPQSSIDMLRVLQKSEAHLQNLVRKEGARFA